MPKKNHITLSQRLALLGLEDRESELKNLNVKEGTELRLSSKDPRHAKRIAQIPVKSARELKRLLGVPDGAIGQDTPPKAHPEGFVSTLNGLPFLPFPAVPLMDKET